MRVQFHISTNSRLAFIREYRRAMSKTWGGAVLRAGAL